MRMCLHDFTDIITTVFSITKDFCEYKCLTNRRNHADIYRFNDTPRFLSG